MAQTGKVLYFVFNLSDGKKFSFGLREPKDGLTQNEVRTVAEKMVTEGFFTPGTRTLASISEVYIQEVVNTRIISG